MNPANQALPFGLTGEGVLIVLSASAAFLISQKQLVERELEAAFAPETFQVPVRSITALTSLDFSHLREFDALDGEREQSDSLEESTDLALPGVRLASYADLRL